MAATNVIKIFVDQGHNPENPNAGAEANGLREQDINYQVGIYLAQFLEMDPRFAVMLSRPTPETSLGNSVATSLAERVRMANEWPADYFISIHCNSNENPAINGTEVYVYQLDSTAAKFGRSILDAIVARVGTKDNGLRVNSTLYVLRKTTMPAVLVELAYLTNPQNAQLLENNQWSFAYAIYEGILNYFGYRKL
ncbi:N-acetylmuramoyl-L-alanine amidase LytC [bioreactor metagenome]|uniref:N-acetylmuramoyl-L-alanine amidase LytC n=1 Tax=bioreactor metagenome TaxID=1076179 RepID=A0A644ZLG2_9ZZZZ